MQCMNLLYTYPLTRIEGWLLAAYVTQLQVIQLLYIQAGNARQPLLTVILSPAILLSTDLSVCLSV